MFCLKCGKELNDTSAFCPICGTPCSPKAEAPAGTGISNPQMQSGATSVPADSKPRKKKSAIFKIVIPVTAVILVLVALPFVFPELIPAITSKVFGDKDTVISESSEATIKDSSEVVNNKNGEAVEPSSVSYDDLLANLEEAYTAVETVRTQESNTDTGNSDEDMKQIIIIWSELQQTLGNLQAQSTSFAENDAKLQDAVLSYYSFASCYAKVVLDYYVFFERYIDSETFLYRPNIFDTNRTHQENYDAMKNWYELTKNEYASFEYPSFVEAYWKEYDNILDLNQAIMTKYAWAINLKDPLRLSSCQYLFERYNTVRKKWFDDVVKSSGNMSRSYGDDKSYICCVNLYTEIQNYIELSEKEKEAYVFKNNKSDAVFWQIGWVDTIYPSLYNAYDSFVILNLATFGGQRNIVIEVEIPGFTQKYRQSYTITSTAKQLFIKPPLLTGNLDLTSAKTAQINMTIYEQNGTQIATYSQPVTIKSKNDVEWYSSDFGVFTKDNILCFLTPESSGIASLKRSAIDEITKMTGGKMELLPGYQQVLSNRYAVTYLQAAALMRAMYNSGVRYCMDDFSVSGSQQHVLLPDQVLELRSGLCIETSLVIASALQSAGMHAFLIFPPGHALVAVEVWNSGTGAGEYFLIETTALSEDEMNGTAFEEYAAALLKGELDAENNSWIKYMNNAQWAEYLKTVQYVIDCDDSRILGMTPFSN